MKYLSINLTKHVQDGYTKNYKTLIGTVKDNLNIINGETSCVYGLKDSTD